MTADGKLKVLIVDDNKHARTLVRSILMAIDANVAEAGTGKDGLASWREFAPDLVIVDFEMPGMTGAEFTQNLRREDARLGRRTAVLLMTAHGDQRRVTQAARAGIDGVIAKPIAPATLFARVEAALQRRAKDLAQKA